MDFPSLWYTEITHPRLANMQYGNIYKYLHSIKTYYENILIKNIFAQPTHTMGIQIPS